MKFLILGAYCSCNLGDAVICRCAEEMLRKSFPGSEITIRDMIRRDRTAPRKEPSVRSLWKWRVGDKLFRLLARLGLEKRLLDREKGRVRQNLPHIEQICAGDYDAVVFAGGQMFMDRYALFLEACVSRFQEREIPVFFNACGTGPDDSPAIRERLKRTLSAPNVVYVSCRDDVERVNRRYLEGGRQAVSTCDPALSAAEVYGAEKAADAETVGLGVIYPNAVSPRKALKLWQGIIRELEGQGRPWQFFSNGDPADIVFARRVISSMPELRGREEALILPWDREPEDLVRHISQYKSLISYRLHSHVIACSLDIPTVALVWDKKLLYFFEKIGHRERCFPVESAARDVLNGLERAEREGYDRALITAQAEASARQLTQAILAHFPQWR